MKYEYLFDCIDKEYYIILILNDSEFGITSDSGIANFLGISLAEYQDILIKFNADIIDNKGFNIGLFFDNKKDCKNAIKYLYEITDQYLVTKELVGG